MRTFYILFLLIAFVYGQEKDLSEELGDINDQPEIEDVPILEDEEGDVEPAAEPEVIPESEPEAEPEVEKEADAEPEPSAEPGFNGGSFVGGIVFTIALMALGFGGYHFHKTRRNSI